ncbi:hypothetical protein [Stenoxybacter acetivorans]|nr:hypothetical protein [Stenoxybacter acetivorans]
MNPKHKHFFCAAEMLPLSVLVQTRQIIANPLTAKAGHAAERKANHD